MLDLLAPLADLLKCLVLWLVGLLSFAVVSLVNLFIKGLMLLLGPLIDLLPTVQLADYQPPAILGLLNWLFPVDQLVLAVTVVVTLLVVWQVVQIALRWLKVVE